MIQELEIWSAEKDNLAWSNQIPVNFSSLILPAANAAALAGNGISMLFQNFQKKEYAIWYSHYYSSKRKKLFSRADTAVIEFSFLIHNNVFQSITPYNDKLVKETQFNIFYLPFIENNVIFEAGEQYTTLDIHCSVNFLQNLSPYFPGTIEPFFELISKGRPAQIFPIHIFGTNAMLSIAKQIIRELRQSLYNELIVELNVKLLISYALACKDEMVSGEKTITVKEMSEINRISNMILKKLFEPPLIRNLARDAGMNETTFKKSFKAVLQKPPYQYWSDHRMDMAFYRIVNSCESVTDIALDLGFSTVASFSKAFTKKFKLPPTAYRK